MNGGIQHWMRKVEQGRLLLEEKVGKESGHTMANISCSPTHRDETGTASLMLPHSTSGTENSWKREIRVSACHLAGAR